MSRFSIQMLISLLIVGSMTFLPGASPAIGTATANGTFRVDNAAVSGNATLFDGARVETGSVPSLLQLESGARLRLGSESRGTIYRERLVLERGEGQVDKGEMEARSLRIVASGPNASARVSLNGGKRLQVTALAGPVAVTTASGTLLANVDPGTAVEFEPQAAGASAPFTITGCIFKADGHHFLRDQTAKVTLEIRGSNLDKEVGRRVEIKGTALPGVKPAPSASEVIRVIGLTRVSGGCVGIIPAAGAASAGKKTTGAGISGASKAVIAGIVVAGAVAGTAVALNDEEPEEDSISR